MALTSGIFFSGARAPAFGVDHHSTYLKAWLNQTGVTEITELRFQPTFSTAQPEEEFERAKQAAREAGCRLEFCDVGNAGLPLFAAGWVSLLQGSGLLS